TKRWERAFAGIEENSISRVVSRDRLDGTMRSAWAPDVSYRVHALVRSPRRKALQCRAIHFDAEAGTVRHAHNAAGVLDRLRQERLADRMFGTVEFEQGLER